MSRTSTEDPQSVSAITYPEVQHTLLQYSPIVFIGYFAFADEEVEAEFQQHFADIMACFDARCLGVGVTILYLYLLKQELPVPVLAWCFPLLLLGVMYLNIREAKLYRQTRRLLLGACKAFGVVMLIAMSASSGCCPTAQLKRTFELRYPLEFVGKMIIFFTMQLPGRVATMLFAALACQVSWRVEAVMQCVLILGNLVFAPRNCRPECLARNATYVWLHQFREALSYTMAMVGGASSASDSWEFPVVSPATKESTVLLGPGEMAMDCEIVTIWLQVALGSVAPLCISYLTEAKARSAYARTRGWRYRRPYECCGLVVTLLVVWAGCAVVTNTLLEAFYAYPIRSYFGVPSAPQPLPEACMVHM